MLALAMDRAAGVVQRVPPAGRTGVHLALRLGPATRWLSRQSHATPTQRRAGDHDVADAGVSNPCIDCGEVETSLPARVCDYCQTFRLAAALATYTGTFHPVGKRPVNKPRPAPVVQGTLL